MKSCKVFCTDDCSDSLEDENNTFFFLLLGDIDGCARLNAFVSFLQGCSERLHQVKVREEEVCSQNVSQPEPAPV